MKHARLRRTMLILITVATLYTNIFVYTKSACIIVHGTWAKNCSWHKPGGDFYESLKASLHEYRIADELISFQWSGLLGDLAHKEAAENLAKLIVLYDAVIVVAHSHGATVGIIASKILGLQYSGRNFYGKIAKFYALGVPVDPTGLLYPDMSVIDKFYNLFSFGDQIQRVHGIYNRCFGPHDRMTNIAVMLDQLHPSHTALHDPAVGKYLLMIPGVLQKSGVGNFHIYRDADPAQISFFRSSCPQYALQPDQNSLLDLDVRAFQLMQMAFMRSPNRYPDSSI